MNNNNNKYIINKYIYLEYIKLQWILLTNRLSLAIKSNQIHFQENLFIHTTIFDNLTIRVRKTKIKDIATCENDSVQHDAAILIHSSSQPCLSQQDTPSRYWSTTGTLPQFSRITMTCDLEKSQNRHVQAVLWCLQHAIKRYDGYGRRR
jgi:hypothetical protein